MVYTLRTHIALVRQSLGSEVPATP
jgi:hypothetical protein